MDNVLVTGGAGFVPSHVVEALIAQGLQVTVIDNLSDAPRSNLAAVEGRVRFIEGDIRDESLIEQTGPVDTIFHFAANANVPRSSQEPLHDASTNILGTINMLNLARRHGAHLILASSAAVYGEPVAPPMAEDHQLLPISPYGVSKLAAESYVGLYRRLYGVRGTVVRLFNIFGPRARRYVVFDFARKILASDREVTMLGDGRQVRSQLFVTDAARAFLLIAERAAEPVYNIGSTRSLTVTEIMEKMLPLFGAQRVLRTSQTSWDGDIQRLVPNIDRLRSLGFSEQVSFEQGLAAFKDWFLTEYGQKARR